MLVSKGKMQMAEAPRAWFERLCNLEGLQLADLSIAVLINAGSLPDLAHGDPADRIIIATAREYGMRIVTRDRKILDYAEKGHVLALAC